MQNYLAEASRKKESTVSEKIRQTMNNVEEKLADRTVQEYLVHEDDSESYFCGI